MGANLLIGPNADRIANALTLIAEAQAGTIEKITDWYTVKRVVASGMGPALLPVGYQITDDWKKTAQSTALDAVWDVVHHDSKGMFLCWHYEVPVAAEFDGKEAIYYVGENGLAAGTYNIGIGKAYMNGWSTSKTIQFTLSSACDAGDQIVIDCGTSGNVDPTNDRALYVYAKGSTVVKQQTTTSNGASGTSLGSTSSSSGEITNGQVNAPSRAVYGNARWSESAVRQYLNSDKAAGEWWEPKNPWDRPPTNLIVNPGFLSGCTDEFLSILEEVEVTTAVTPFSTGSDWTLDKTMDKIFIPSIVQYNVDPYNEIENQEGEKWDYYVKLARSIGVTGTFSRGVEYDVLNKYSIGSTSNNIRQFLRTASPTHSSISSIINATTGIVAGGGSSLSSSWSPTCKITR